VVTPQGRNKYLFLWGEKVSNCLLADLVLGWKVDGVLALGTEILKEQNFKFQI